MAGLGLFVQETSCVYKAGTYEKLGVGDLGRTCNQCPSELAKEHTPQGARKLAAELRCGTAVKLCSGPPCYSRCH